MEEVTEEQAALLSVPYDSSTEQSTQPTPAEPTHTTVCIGEWLK